MVCAVRIFLFGIASFALAIGPKATWCEIAGLVGLHTHHHAIEGGSICVASHSHHHHDCSHGHSHHGHSHSPSSHEEEHVPCDSDSAFDLPEISLTKADLLSTPQFSVELPPWLSAWVNFPRVVDVKLLAEIFEPSDRSPPDQCSPPFTGCFLI